MNTETITTTSNATSTLPPVTEAPPETAYTNLSHLAATYGIHAAVHLEQRVLAEFSELDPMFGDDTAGLILAVLAFHLHTGTIGNAGRLPICLLRRQDQQLVEVDLLVLCHERESGQHIYLRAVDIREIANPALN